MHHCSLNILLSSDLVLTHDNLRIQLVSIRTTMCVCSLACLLRIRRGPRSSRSLHRNHKVCTRRTSQDQQDNQHPSLHSTCARLGSLWRYSTTQSEAEQAKRDSLLLSRETARASNANGTYSSDISAEAASCMLRDAVSRPFQNCA